MSQGGDSDAGVVPDISRPPSPSGSAGTADPAFRAGSVVPDVSRPPSVAESVMLLNDDTPFKEDLIRSAPRSAVTPITSRELDFTLSASSQGQGTGGEENNRTGEVPRPRPISGDATGQERRGAPLDNTLAQSENRRLVGGVISPPRWFSVLRNAPPTASPRWRRRVSLDSGRSGRSSQPLQPSVFSPARSSRGYNS